jgi:2-oxoglutarate dehydrogenase E1 component
VKSEYRKPLIVFTPKKLLRYPKAVSSINDMAKGRFTEVVDDPAVNKKEVDTIAFCSGKVYYDILEQKEKQNIGDNIAVVRLEQLYPLPKKQIETLLKEYNKNCKLLWVQEEPENMGAWTYIMRMMRSYNMDVISPAASASPAPGSSKVHERRHLDMIQRLLNHSKVGA